MRGQRYARLIIVYLYNLDVKNTGFDFFGLTYIPEILAQISAGSSCNIHPVVVLVVTLRAFPLKIIVDKNLSVITAYLTVIGFGVELGVLDIVVNILNKFLKCRQIMSEIRYLNIGYCTAA